MKHKLLILILSVIISALNLSDGYSQTDGTLTITFNQPQPTSPAGTKNVIAVWIEDNAGTFIKTKMRYWGAGTNDHLPTWVNKSGQSTLSAIVDASTGPTRTSGTNPTAFGSKTVTWDGKSSDGISNGPIVADGTYKVWIESSWQTSLATNTHNDIISFSFTKGTSPVNMSPMGDTYFNTISLNWAPVTSSVSKLDLNQSVFVYPNPASDFINIVFQQSYSDCKISIKNSLGQIIYDEKLNQINSGNKYIDVSNFSRGIYFLNIQADNQITNFRVVIR